MSDSCLDVFLFCGRIGFRAAALEGEGSGSEHLKDSEWPARCWKAWPLWNAVLIPASRIVRRLEGSAKR